MCSLRKIGNWQKYEKKMWWIDLEEPCYKQQSEVSVSFQIYACLTKSDDFIVFSSIWNLFPTLNTLKEIQPKEFF